jgi:hypothetical protein
VLFIILIGGVGEMSKKRKKWEFTPKRRASMKKAQEEHVRLVELGKKARARGMR